MCFELKLQQGATLVSNIRRNPKWSIHFDWPLRLRWQTNWCANVRSEGQQLI
jgi:hypothetical protein